MEVALSIGQVVKRTGQSIDTLRYYERIGSIESVSWATTGHCRYRHEDLDWIGLLIRLRETGMPLVQMIHFANLRRQGPQAVRERRLLLERHLHDVEQQMQPLKQHGGVLQHKIDFKERETHVAAVSRSDNIVRP
jgi:DNA-binding transcriptional MerR regulator